jgi:hypothetical protein
MITVYKAGTIVPRIVIDVDSTSDQSVSLMKEDTLNINFSLATAEKIYIGDYCTFFGKTYQVNKRPTRKKTAKGNYQYSLVMEADFYDLGKVDFHFLDANNVFTESTFDMRGTPKEFGDLIIFNMRRVYPLANWILGFVVSGDIKTISFDAQNCLQALQTIAKEYSTEYTFDGKSISIYQNQKSSGITLEYGKENPLKSITESDQDNSNFVTRLYAYGSNKNLPPGYRNGATYLRMGANLSIEKNVSTYGIFEKTVKFDGTNGLAEIYPHRTGVLSSVIDPFNFSDGSINFDVNVQKVPGITPQIVFNTGLLSGYTFDIANFDNSTKIFTINKNQSETSFDIPSTTLKPVVGDTYVLINIAMPQTYIDKAEADLRLAAKGYLDDKSIPLQSYAVECNPSWFKKNNPTINIGDSIEIKDVDLDVDRITRIIGYKRNLRQPSIYTMTLADNPPPTPLIVKFINGI